MKSGRELNLQLYYLDRINKRALVLRNRRARAMSMTRAESPAELVKLSEMAGISPLDT